MSQWCVESYPSSLYKFEIFSKLMFLAFCPQFWPGPGGAKSMPTVTDYRLPTGCTLHVAQLQCYMLQVVSCKVTSISVSVSPSFLLSTFYFIFIRLFGARAHDGLMDEWTDGRCRR